MKVKPTKRYRLNYDITDKKLRDALDKVIKRGEEPTVKLVSEEAGVSVSTAYIHKCQELIRKALLEE